jgi:hypothetical protein
MKPKNVHDNFGVYARWTDDAIGTVGLYYRHFDELQPWSPLIDSNPRKWHLGWAQNVSLFGASWEGMLGDYSIGAEASYRLHTALNSSQTDSTKSITTAGATGNTFNAIVNFLYTLKPTFMYDTGSMQGEVAWTHLDAVTGNKAMYKGIGYAGCTTGTVGTGCDTRDAAALNMTFEPQWLQVLPSLNLSMPLKLGYGFYGNGASLSGPTENAVSYSAGISAIYLSCYYVTLAYNGGHAHHGPTATNIVNGQQYFASGNGAYYNNDRDWISLSLKTTL